MKPTKRKSLAYMREVKEVFAKQGKFENFHHFVQLLQDFRSKKFEAAAVVNTFKQLFQGHPHLLLGFNAFLPKEHQITSQPRPPPLAFPKPLISRDDDDDDVYESFINIMASYRMISKSSKRKPKANSSSSCESSDNNREATEVIYRKVAALFKDHPDLLQEFTRFLPPLRQDYHSNLEVTTTVKDKDHSRSSNCTPSYC
ncbi:paired amphipathic helix protein Sin3-like 3 [Pyrus ussuriensis x Pyrus communis]|uniref:Paired amphipathic helix protein Sin3-like 3 n=1 Tax=Pyrus ussuriensis x Pyrus communis TaxID=2448454 RepID=A0A5N5HW94_9ROSA|nr:paired amphipathic helix protein Sin3-like 3 [Pyrus ussuriensis x Pyrus communis]